MTAPDDILAGIEADPDPIRWQVLGDWLEEHDDPRRAELLRLHRLLLATCCEPDEHTQRAVWQKRIVELLDLGVQPCVPRRTVRFGRSVGMIFGFVPPGAFLMGSPESEPQRNIDEPQRRVTLTRGFWLAASAVTRAQWRWVTGKTTGTGKGNDLPVAGASWDDCEAFRQKLEEKVGLRFRLPTEAEWEYACRAGTTTPFFFGETISTDQANYFGSCVYGNGTVGIDRYEVTPADHLPPNAWGLRGMHGNVWEWCQDWYRAYLKRDQKDPVGRRVTGYRVLRGGCWHDHPSGLRSANRRCCRPNANDPAFGCRLALCPV